MPLPTRPAFLSYIAGALLLGAVLAGCTEDYAGGPDASSSTKHLQPLAAATYEELGEKAMTPADPILLRIYKDESKLEVWKKRTQDGRYAFFKSYEICRWSGVLGPKVKEGDKQAPEGFYTVSPGQMNPKSSYYLSFNMGYPNNYDRALGRTGTNLMVHGACSSAGCYSMTDQNIAEIYALARESFNGGQRSFQVQAFPFRMTAENMARYRKNPSMPFWKNLKEGSDHFEVTRQEPRVGVCGRRYVFDATAPDGTPLSASAPCPQLEVPPEIGQAVAAKAKADEVKVALLATKIEEAPVEVRQAAPKKKAAPTLLASWADRNTSKPLPKSAVQPGPTQVAANAAAAARTNGSPTAGVQVASLETSAESVFGRLFGGGSNPAPAEGASGEQAQAYAAEQEQPLYKRVLDFSWLKGKPAAGAEQTAPQANPTVAAASSGLPAVADARIAAAPSAAPTPSRPAPSAAPAGAIQAAVPQTAVTQTASAPGTDPLTTGSVPAPPKKAALPKQTVAEPIEPLRAAPVTAVHSAEVPPPSEPAPQAVPAAPMPEPAAVVSASPAPAAPAAAPASSSRISGAFSYFN